MKKKYETLKSKELKQKLIDLIEAETNNSIKIIESKNTKIKEIFSIPIYVDLEDYTNEKLNEIIDENYDDIITELSNEDYISTLALIFEQQQETEIFMTFKVSNRDDDNEECLNFLLEY